MNSDFTTKQVAQALRVSESSVKRWCDRGEIEFARTVGGHRRITEKSLFEYLRKAGRLGESQDAESRALRAELHRQYLPNDTIASWLESQEIEFVDPIQHDFFEALITNNEAQSRLLLMQFFAKTNCIAAVADQLVCPCFTAIGKLWEAGELQIFEERQAVTVTQQLLHELRRILPQPTSNPVIAIGASLAGDHYCLGTALVEAVFRQHGLHAINIGCNLPVETLAQAIIRYRPRYVWLSISHHQISNEIQVQLANFTAQLSDSVSLLVGGRMRSLLPAKFLDKTIEFATMRELASFAGQLKRLTHSN